MALLDASSLAQHQFDLCIVGMGPAGITLALEAEKRGLTVLMVDAGSIDGTPVTTDSATIQDPLRHAPLPLASYRGLGGTSWLWGGRCVPFEEIDFAARPFIPDSGWPCSYQALREWYGTAAKYLDCGNATFSAPLPEWPALDNFSLEQHERWARQPQLAHRLKERILAAPRIHLLCDTHVTHITFDATQQHVQGLQAHQGTTPLSLHATRYVLACGGVETTRLLLSTQHQHPALFGGPEGPLGRYYMGHIFGSIASIVLSHPADVKHLDFSQDATGTYVRRRFTLTAQAQQTHALCNTGFFIDNPPFYDARHQHATLSLIFLALRIPAIGRRLIAEAIRLRHIGPPPYAVGAHIVNIVRNPLRTLQDAIMIVRQRYLSVVRKPGFILRNAGGTYALNYHAEQYPNPHSRITIAQAANATDRLPTLHIDFRYTEQDVASVIAAHALLDTALRDSGKGYVHYHRDATQRAAHVMEQATDGFHQVGTTRMGDDPATSVVNADGQVHGIDNLFIASSSVFPTTGEANPTFLLAAFAARMAAHLAATATSATPTTPVADATSRV